MNVILFATRFPAYHSRAGAQTGFVGSIVTGKKVHTLRHSDRNRRSGDRVSLRYWTGRPYASKQMEFGQCTIRVTPIMLRFDPLFQIAYGNESTRPLGYSELLALSQNDGFERIGDFVDWFKGKDFVGYKIWMDDVKIIA